MPVFYEDYPEAWSKDNNEYKIRKAERSSNSCSVEWRIVIKALEMEGIWIRPRLAIYYRLPC